MVEPSKLYTDATFEEKYPGAVHITIAELKYAYGEISGKGTNNDGWSNNVYKVVGEDIFEGKDVYIKGKVMSDDTEGNIYKSLFIQDETSAIELRLNNNVGLLYKRGTWVYVRLKGLYLGNYRMMLSLGGPPSESYNKAGKHKFYTNSNIELQSIIDKHVFVGESAGEIVVGSYDDWKNDKTSVDIITVTPENYIDVFSPSEVKIKGKFYGTETTDADGSTIREFEIKQRELMFGRTIRFEDLQCRYAGSPAMRLDENLEVVKAPVDKDDNGENDVDENGNEILEPKVYDTELMVSGNNTNQYPAWMYTDWGTPETKPWYNWAFKEEITGRSLYASVLFAYDMDSSHGSANGIYALRTSGYSRFARQPICYDRQTATITAIYGIYSQKSDYSATTEDWATYQLTVNGRNDIVFKNGEKALLTEEHIDILAQYWFDKNIDNKDSEKKPGDIYFVDWIDKFDDEVGE